ncbi:MAG: hypothetical protein HRT92_02405 [Piscirickettsiaceae bacterium]|nr:hypothetical protein [Piscirickettsiaceae bacterium]
MLSFIKVSLTINIFINQGSHHVRPKQESNTKAEITRQMYPLLKDEPRGVISQAFIEGYG